MTENITLELLRIIILLNTWLIIFILLYKWANKTFIYEKNFSGRIPPSDAHGNLLGLYYSKKIDYKLFIRSEKFNDLITNGKLIIEIDKQANCQIKISYERKVKPMGYLILFLSVAFFCIGIPAPILILRATKKKAEAEIEKMLTVSEENGEKHLQKPLV